MASHAVLYSWRHASRTGRALAAPDRPRNPSGKTRPPYAEAERVAAVSAYRTSGLTQRTFARVWGLSIKTLSAWLTRVAREGDKGLQPRKPGRRKGSVSASGLSPRVQQEIVSVRERFPGAPQATAAAAISTAVPNPRDRFVARAGSGSDPERWVMGCALRGHGGKEASKPH
jgi:hypothetical protein